MAENSSTTAPTFPPFLAVGKQVDIEARTWAGINKPGGHATITKVHTDDGGYITKVDVKYALGGVEKDVDLTHVKAHVELERGGRKRRNDVKMNVEHLGGVPKKKSKKKKRVSAAKKTAVGVSGGGGTKAISAFRQITLSLPTGPLGLAIHQQESGHCLVTARNPDINSPVLENDIILSVNGIKLKGVEGGKSGWVQIFSSLVNMPREVVVSRRADTLMVPSISEKNDVGMKEQRESSGVPNAENEMKKKKKTTTKCGECEACVRKDCGTCRQCRDKPKFGGPGKLRQKCIHRRCIVVGPKQKLVVKEEIKNVARPVTSTNAPTGVSFESKTLMNSTSKDTECFSGDVGVATSASSDIKAGSNASDDVYLGTVVTTAARAAASFDVSSKEGKTFGGHVDIAKKAADIAKSTHGSSSVPNFVQPNAPSVATLPESTKTISEDLAAVRRQNCEDLEMFEVYIPQIVTVLNQRSGAFHGQGSQPTIKKELQAAMGESFSSTAFNAALREMVKDGELVKDGCTYKLRSIVLKKEVDVPALPSFTEQANDSYKTSLLQTSNSTESFDLKGRLNRVSLSPVAIMTATSHPADRFGKTITVNNRANEHGYAPDNTPAPDAGMVASTAAPADASLEEDSMMCNTGRERKSFGGHIDIAKKAAEIAKSTHSSSSLPNYAQSLVHINESGDLIVGQRHEMENTPSAYRARIIKVLNQQSGAYRGEGTIQTIQQEMQNAMGGKVSNAAFDKALRRMVEDGELVCTYRLNTNLLEKPDNSILTRNILASEKQSAMVESSEQTVTSASSLDSGAHEHGTLNNIPLATHVENGDGLEHEDFLNEPLSLPGIRF